MTVTIIFRTYIVLLPKLLQDFTKDIRLSLKVATESEEESYMTCQNQHRTQLQKCALSWYQVDSCLVNFPMNF